jgi:hypothetical protein
LANGVVLQNAIDYFKRNKLFFSLLISLVALVVLDGFITRFLVKSGMASEANPLLQKIADKVDLLVVKIAGSLAAAVILWDVQRHWRRLGTIACALFVAVYAGIVIWNTYLFFFS